MKLGELKTGDTLYIIHWESGYIGYIDKCIIKDIKNIKIGRIIDYYKENDKDTIYSATLEFSEYNNDIASAFYLCQMCADKDVLYEIIEDDREKCLNKYSHLLNKFK